MRRALSLLVVLIATAFAAGCGGGGGGGGSAAGLVPPDALAFVTVNTDLGSGQDAAAEAVLNKFPIKVKLLDAIRKGVASSGLDLNALESSVGPEVDVAVLQVSGKPAPVGFTQPKDEKAFDGQLEAGKQPLQHANISGWTVFAQTTAALDAIRNRTANLSDLQPFKDAIAAVPSSGNALATAYVVPGTIQQGASKLGSTGGLSTGSLGLDQVKWIAAAATSHDGGIGVEVHANGIGGSVPATASALASQIPAGSLLALSVRGTGSLLPKVGALSPSVLAAIQAALGVSLADIAQALSGDTILYVRAGTPIPEATLAAMPADPQAAAATVGKLLSKVAGGAKPEAATLGGFPFHRFALGPIDLYYGLFGNELVVTDSQNAVTELQAKGNKLAADPVFKAVKDAAKMPDATQGFLYVNLKDGIPTAEGLLRLANQTIPASVSGNLAPLRSLLVFGSHDGSTETLSAFLQTS